MNDKGESVQELHYFGARACRLGGDGYVADIKFLYISTHLSYEPY